jgi:radical S-adenosyl methionine domain-containing protein 2
MLADSGMKKVNLVGGEPLLFKAYVGTLAKYCKEELHLEAVSIGTNGSLLDETFLDQWGQYVDMFTVSIDSFNDEVNEEIGRRCDKLPHSQVVKHVAELCATYNKCLKLNTVVCSLNKNEVMVHEINKLNPVRWKVFQMLLIEGENLGPGAERDGSDLVISRDEFQSFVTANQAPGVKMVVESNDIMRNSYLILDEQMRFLDNSNGTKHPGQSILSVGVEQAIRSCHFDAESFNKRDGHWNWSINNK